MSLRGTARYIFFRLPIRFRCLIESLRSKGKLTIGEGSYIHQSVHILGKKNIRIGSNTCVSEGSWLNVNHIESGSESIVIGDNCFIGKQNFFTSGKSIHIGDYVLTTIGCKFIGSTHKFEDPKRPYISTGTTDIDRIYIGVNCFLGAASMVLGNVRIGHGSIIGANALVMNDIPPFSIAVGNPALVVKRYSFAKDAWVLVSELAENDLHEMPSETDYLASIKAQFPKLAMPWIAGGKSLGDI